MASAIGNLLSNAIRFSPVGGIIQFRLSTRAGRFMIDVLDQGPGVAADDRARIFEPFYRGERQPDDAVKGSGVGLSIVHAIAALHGGSLAIERSPLGGARLVMRLPAQDRAG